MIHGAPPAARTGAPLLLTAAAFVIIAAGLKTAQALVNPLLLSIFIAIISTPPLFWLEARGLARGPALTIVIAAVVIILSGLSVVVGASVNDFAGSLPLYSERLQVQFGSVLEQLGKFGVTIPQTPDGFIDHMNPAWVLELAGILFNSLGGMLANVFLILLTVIFILLEAAHFSNKVSAITGGASATRASISAATQTIQRYLAIKSLMSLGTGVAIGLWLWIIGVDYPVLWGLFSFLLNYVPNIGSIIAAVPAVLLALVQLGPAAALWSAGGYLAVNVLLGNIIEPRFMGRGLGLSPLVVFISLIFWGWVLGPIGMFLSVPLTITAKIAFAANADTRWIAILLGPADELPSSDSSHVDSTHTPFRQQDSNQIRSTKI